MKPPPLVTGSAALFRQQLPVTVFNDVCGLCCCLCIMSQALLARQTSGMSGADLANLVNEAALLAAKLGADAIAPSMVDYAYDKVLMGVERKSAVRSPEALKRTAYHEGGHALVSGGLFCGEGGAAVH